ncbi:MAG: hypothetical protein ACP5PV_01390 [Methanothrix sp.]
MDFSISESERICKAAKEDLLHKRDEVWADRLKADEQLSFLVYEQIRNTKTSAGQYLQIVAGKIDQAEARARSTISQHNEKPKATDAEITQRWGSLTRLFDSMKAGNVITAMRAEMETGEPISRYQLRSHDAELYINSKQVELSAFFAMIADTTDILEPDIRESALEIVKALEQRKATIPAWKALVEAIDELGRIAASIFGDKPFNSSKPIRAQQQMDGSVNLSFPNVTSFREWCRTPRGV